jgi:hypothetical protein
MKRKLSSVTQFAKKKAIPITRADAEAGNFNWPDGRPIDTSHMLIQLMLPPAVKAFYEELARDVDRLCGARGKHDGEDGLRWGSQRGSAFFSNQRIAVEHPRVRSKTTGEEIVPEAYAKFQNPRLFEQSVFVDGMKHVSQRDFAKGLPLVAASFGVSKSAVSRRWINATAKKLDELMERDLTAMDIVAVFIDGKRFKKHGVVVALGVSSIGKKFVLGIYQANTETGAAVMNLLNGLEKRGLPKKNLLFIVDGGSGLNSCLNQKYSIDDPTKRTAVRARCWVHRWWNIEEVLSDEHVEDCRRLYWAIRNADTFELAKKASNAFKAHLGLINKSARKTFEETEDELLVIHQLNLTADLRVTLSTTNPIESLNSLTEEDTRRVKSWKDSAHFQRWLATACLHSEKRMKRVKGYRGLAALKIALASMCCSHLGVDNERKIA